MGSRGNTTHAPKSVCNRPIRGRYGIYGMKKVPIFRRFCGSGWSRAQFRDQEVGGSNPLAPIALTTIEIAGIVQGTTLIRCQKPFSREPRVPKNKAFAAFLPCDRLAPV